MNKVIIFFLAFLTLFSCRNRTPNLSEKQLLALSAENKLPEPEVKSRPNMTMPEGYVPQAGVKYRQKRDLSVPPVRIDILKGVDDVRKVTLSQITKDMMYVNLGDKHRGTVSVQVTPHGILVSSYDGVWLYDTEGRLIREIYKNYCEWGVSFSIIFHSKRDIFNGVEQIHYNKKDDRIWLKYREGDAKNYRGHFGYIDMGQMNISNSETRQSPIIPLGKFCDGQMAYAENFVIHRPWRQENFLTTHTFFGDTLCRFTFGCDSIIADIFRKSRGGIYSYFSYHYHGKFTIRPVHNDTIFRITAANVLKPEYILDLGNVTKPDMSYDQLNLLSSLWEDDRYLYMDFSTGKNDRSNERVQHIGLYDKSKREFFTIPCNNAVYLKGIENDIDGGLPFWGSIGSSGEKYMNFQGKAMKTLLTDAWFAQSKALYPEKKEELKQFVKTLKDDDLVIVIVK